MPLLRTYRLLFLMLCLCGVSTAQIYNTEVEAKLDLVDNGQYIQIEGSAVNKTGIVRSLRYILSVINNDSLNPSKEDLTGRFILESGAQKNLKGTTIPSNNKEKLTILLLIYNFENKLLGLDRVVLNGDESDKLKRIVVSKDGIYSRDEQGTWMIRGLMEEDTKTKFGRDFYRYFNDMYRENKVNGKYVVKVKESFALANTSKIEIIINNRVFLEFVLPPKDDVIKDYAAQSVDRVAQYFRQEEINSTKIRY